MPDPAGVQDRHPSFATPKKFLILERLARIYDHILMAYIMLMAYIIRRETQSGVVKKTAVEEKGVSVRVSVCPRVRVNYYFSFVSL